eukprot:scaffold1365_cov163-Ochromonas_danica.AAC.56
MLRQREEKNERKIRDKLDSARLALLNQDNQQVLEIFPRSTCLGLPCQKKHSIAFITCLSQHRLSQDLPFIG